MHFSKLSLASGLLLAGSSMAIDLDLSDESSIKNAAKTIATSIVDRYNSSTSSNGTHIPGQFGEGIHWWESGLAWDSLIHYWHQTGDDSYNDIIGEALRYQLGIGNGAGIQPANQTNSMGHDEQSTWALTAMTAAEYGFPTEALAGSNFTSWANISQDIFKTQASRFEEITCGGGIRWRIFPDVSGYDYKNSLSNGNLYQLAGRLARWTNGGNYNERYNGSTSEYELLGQSVVDWAYDVGLIGDVNSTSPGAVYDGADASGNCSSINHIQWSANAGTFLAGSAYMSNYSNTINNMNYQAFVPAINYTFASGRDGSSNGTLTEIACASRNNCNTDQLAYRAILARAMAQTRALTTPSGSTFTYDRPVDIWDRENISQAERIPAWNNHARIDFILQQSAIGAAAQCSGGEHGTTCGNDWSSSTYDGTEGLGQDLSALNVILANIPISYDLATGNSEAGEAGASRGTIDDANSTITNLDDLIDAGADAAKDAAADAAASSAGHIAVSSFGLLAAVGSAVMFL